MEFVRLKAKGNAKPCNLVNNIIPFRVFVNNLTLLYKGSIIE